MSERRYRYRKQVRAILFDGTNGAEIAAAFGKGVTWDPECLRLRTGDRRISRGEYAVRLPEGLVLAIAPDDFERIYEPVEDWS